MQDANRAVQDPVEKKPFHIVGIGASAGGLKALEDFFRRIPPDIGMAFVVIQHLSPQYKSVMPELLARQTQLNVQHVNDSAVVEPGTVHLIPPGKNLIVRDGRLQLSDQPALRGVNLPIDIFFRSLAEDFGERAIGIILSGTGTDGTLGVREIKGAGGMVMVQSPESAQFDGMPRSAIATRMVDFVMEAEDMPEKLVQYASYPQLSRVSENTQIEQSAIQRLLPILEAHSGVDFSGYRRSTFFRRLDKRMQMNQMETLDEYLAYVEKNSAEIEALYQDVLIGVTSFFRDAEAFQLLREQVVPKLWARLAQSQEGETPQELRVWSVACSTGEEAYSLAVCLYEGARLLGIDPKFKVFATDVDRQALRVASDGSYPESATADIPPELLGSYFHRKGDRCIVNDTLRQKVIFSMHDVTRNPPFNRIDLLSCRNMLIYLTTETQKRVLSNFCFSLRPGGFLYLGSSESLAEHGAFFTTIGQRAKIFRYEGGAKPTLGQLRMTHPGAPIQRSGEGSTPSANDLSGLERNILRQIMSRYAPATAVVNDSHTLLMSFGPIQEYLRLPPGRVTLDLLSMTGGTLGALLATAMHKARQTREEVEYRGLRLKDGGELCNLRVEPLHREGRAEQLYAIVISPTNQQAAEGKLTEIGDETQAHLVDLERELQYTKENLQATIEELETANEELQATNEELLASNEELQSTNEELQSVNEELITVNSEHQSKIAALTEASNDFDNLLLIAEVHTIFLDRGLQIRKFSHGNGPFNLVESDVGRSIRHFALDLEFPDFADEIDRVLQTLVPCERVCRSGDGRDFLIKIVPYRTREDEIRGVVITMVDVTERQAEARRLALLEEANNARGEPIEILLVDDDVQQTKLMQLTLEQSALTNTTHIVHDGKNAREFLRRRLAASEKLPDLLLLDMMLPDCHGLDLLQEFKEDEQLANITVVVVSGVDSQSEIDRAYALGATSYIAKPVTPSRLTECIGALADYWLTVVRLPSRGPAPAEDVGAEA